MSENAPLSVEADLVEEDAGATPAAAPQADVVETEGAASPEDDFPIGTKVLDGMKTIGGAAFEYTLAMPVSLTIANGAGATRAEPVTSIIIHRPTAGDMDAFYKARDGLRTLVLRCMRNPTRAAKIYDKLDGADVAALGHLCTFLATPGQKTGR